MLDNLYIPFKDFDALYIEVRVDMDGEGAHNFVLSAQKTILNRYVKDIKIKEEISEEQSEYFMKEILPLGNVQTVYQMLIEEFKQDSVIKSVRNVVEHEVDEMFKTTSLDDVFNDINSRVNSLDIDKLKDLLSVFVEANSSDATIQENL